MYYPPVAGTILWLQKLRGRIAQPAEDFKFLEDDIVKTEDAAHVFEKIDEMKKILEDEQARIFEEWCKYVPDQIEKSMSKFQLIRIESDLLIDVNFDKEMEAILKEVRYMNLMEIPNIPEEAQKLFEGSEELMVTKQKFNRIMEWYNYLQLQTNAYEHDLIDDEVHQIDDLLKSVIEEHVWFTNGK